MKVMSPRVLKCKDIFFPFLINDYLIGRYFETMQVSYYSSDVYRLILASIICQTVVFYFYHSFPIYELKFSCKEELSLLLHLFLHLIIY